MNVVMLMHRGAAMLGIRRRWSWWLLAALFVGVILIGHGCHGPDEDHEL